VDVGALEDFPTGESVSAEVGHTMVCIARVGDDVLAVHNTCTHALEGMAGGFVDGDTIECPRHGALFSLRTGEAMTPPATKPLPTFPVDVRDGRVLVAPTPSAPHPILDR
jgi:3-phenylpropionate/trans-cinnamate dioxygenase ferredoxin subunit